MHRLYRSKLPFILILLCLIATRFAFSQMDQGSIVGTVLDSTGAVIPHATVKLVNEQTGFALERTSDDGGSYSFTPIKIGTYTITASAQGFRSFEQRSINVTASSRTEVPLTLGTASANQTVEVNAAPPALQTQDASTGATVSAQAIVQTPLLNRNPVFVAQLTPGVVPAESSASWGLAGVAPGAYRKQLRESSPGAD